MRTKEQDEAIQRLVTSISQSHWLSSVPCEAAQKTSHKHINTKRQSETREYCAPLRVLPLASVCPREDPNRFRDPTIRYSQICHLNCSRVFAGKGPDRSKDTAGSLPAINPLLLFILFIF